LFIAAMMALFPFSAIADESLAIYGLRGYAYTYSPLPSNGFHFQTGGIYSRFDEKIEKRDGHIWAVPVSFTYGNGEWWEIAAATHWESWENTNHDVNESGIGDIFVGTKFRFLGSEKRTPLALSLMPYVLIPTGNRDKSIGDLYGYNPSTDDDFSYGVNLLLGKQWGRFYLAGNIGVNYVDTDLTGIEKDGVFLGLALEYQVSETFMVYAEFVNTENKLEIECDPCITENTEDDLREIGAGLVWLYGKWGLKIHGGTGLTDTTPNIRGIGLINLNF